MKVWYVVDSVYSEGLLDEDNIRLFMTEDSAKVYANELEDQRLVSHLQNREHNKEKWEIRELAVEALEKLGIDWTITMPYHNREWNPPAFKPIYEVRSLEVE